MRKLRLTSMTVLSAAAFAVFATQVANAVEVKIGGTINFQAGYTDQEDDFDVATREYGFRNDTEVVIDVAGESEDHGFKYGATIELEADVTGDARAEGLNADKTFIWVEPGYGRFELGNNEGAEQAMAVNAATIARATGGIDGDNEFYINATGIGGLASFLIFPDLPTADIGGIAEDATKVTFYTPNFSGFQFGVSFTPDEGDGGQVASRLDSNGDFENVFSAGLSYEGEWDNIGLQASIVGETGDSELALTEDLNAWQAGLALSFNDISVAGSYGDWDDSGLASGSSADTDFWTAGIAYAKEDWGVSATWFDSDRGGNDYESLVLGVDYTPVSGLTPYAEVTFFDADEAGVALDNDGTILLLGTYLNF